MRCRILASAIMLLCAGTAQAQVDMVGRWEAEVVSPQGNETARFVFNFRREEEDLAGTITLADTPSVPMHGVRLRGDVVSFNQPLGAAPGHAILYIGKVHGDEIAFAAVRIRPPWKGDTLIFTARRVDAP